MSRPANPDTTDLPPPAPKIFGGERATIERRDLADPVAIAALIEQFSGLEGWRRRRRLMSLAVGELDALLRFANAAMPIAHNAAELINLSDADAPAGEIEAALARLCDETRQFTERFSQCLL